MVPRFSVLESKMEICINEQARKQQCLKRVEVVKVMDDARREVILEVV